MSVLNRICNHCLGNSSITDQPMLKMVLAWMLVQRISGVEIGGWRKGFNPFASTYASSPLAQCYCRAELDKKRMYDERICEVENGTFSPLIFSSSGGMGPSATVVLSV